MTSFSPRAEVEEVDRADFQLERLTGSSVDDTAHQLVRAVTAKTDFKGDIESVHVAFAESIDGDGFDGYPIRDSKLREGK